MEHNVLLVRSFSYIALYALWKSKRILLVLFFTGFNKDIENNIMERKQIGYAGLRRNR